MSSFSNVPVWTQPLVLIAFLAQGVVAEAQSSQEASLRRLPSTAKGAVSASGNPFVLTANPDQDRSLLIETPPQERSLTEAEEELLWTRVKRRGAKSFSDKIYRVGNDQARQLPQTQQTQVAKQQKPTPPRPPALTNKSDKPAESVIENNEPTKVAAQETKKAESKKAEPVKVAAKPATSPKKPAVDAGKAPVAEKTEATAVAAAPKPVGPNAEKVEQRVAQAPVVVREPVAVEKIEETVVETPMTTEAETYTTVVTIPSPEGLSQDRQVEGVGYNAYGCGDVGCCDTGCCSECCQPVCCCPPPVCRPTFWVGGVEATFLAADFNNDGVSYLLEDNIASPAVNVPFGSEDSSDLESLFIAPRLWLGIQRCNCGLVARYWHMRAHNNSFDPFVFARVVSRGSRTLGSSRSTTSISTRPTSREPTASAAAGANTRSRSAPATPAPTTRQVSTV